MTLPFDPTSGFHDYRFDYASNSVSFYADGKLMKQWKGASRISSGVCTSTVVSDVARRQETPYDPNRLVRQDRLHRPGGHGGQKGQG
jgi:beta-glucanase (GH16 family)